MQSVEIAKAVIQKRKVVILDEPTSSLTDNEVEAFFRIIRDLKSRGVSMIYISHKMAEIREISDDITIMRDGTYVGTWEVKNICDDEIVKQMVGRELTNVYPPKEDTQRMRSDLKSTICPASTSVPSKDISFRVKEGRDLRIRRSGRRTENRADGRLSSVCVTFQERYSLDQGKKAHQETAGCDRTVPSE